jgi:hypothetical protein
MLETHGEASPLASPFSRTRSSGKDRMIAPQARQAMKEYEAVDGQ